VGAKITVKLTKRKLSPGRLLQQSLPASETGAVVTFSGVVRGTEKRRAIEALEYSSYESMAEKQMQHIAEAASKRWPLKSILIIHRVGKIRVGELSVHIAIGSKHRAEAFAACEYLIDQLKKVVPIWKAIPRATGKSGD